jgi:hypothetical protein
MRFASCILAALAACAAWLSLAIPQAGAEVLNNRTFCAGWHGVCRRVCPSARPSADCAGECSRMAAACRRTGCFAFTNPRPRCIDNATDVELWRQGAPLRAKWNAEQRRRYMGD